MENFKIILGTMTFGPQIDESESRKLVETFVNDGNTEIDSAFVYNEGETERILGNILSGFDVNIATKINPRISGRLDAEAVDYQFNESLNRMNRDSVDLLYLHFPDPVTAVEGALEAINELFEQGKIKELGLSNFPAWEVVKVYHLCDKHNWLKPTVYQGMYNGLSRNIEDELFPAIRDFGIRFYAYNPLAGGLLSGKHKVFSEDPKDGRFLLRPNYKNRYWKESYFEALQILHSECSKENLPLFEVALRWLAFHSKIDHAQGDGILVGVSKIEQLVSNVKSLKNGILPDNIVTAFNSAWEAVRADCPSYFKYIGAKGKPSS
ncbi:MAG: aldo/keto reductase [Cyclobacteriaceae bacterium]